MKSIFWKESPSSGYGILPEYVILDDTNAYQMNLTSSEFLCASNHFELYSNAIDVSLVDGYSDLPHENNYDMCSNVLIIGMNAGLTFTRQIEDKLYFYLGIREQFINTYPQIVDELMCYVEQKLEVYGIQCRNDAYIEFRKNYQFIDDSKENKIKKMN